MLVKYQQHKLAEIGGLHIVVWFVDENLSMATTELSARGVNPARLSDKQLRFVQEYLLGFNATDAAISAGYSKKTARQIGLNLLRNPLVSKLIGKTLSETGERYKVNRARIVEELSYIAFRDVIDLCDKQGRIVISDMREIPEAMRRCIDGIKVKHRTRHDEEGNEIVEQEIELKLVGKAVAIELLMRHLGMFPKDAGSTVNNNIMQLPAGFFEMLAGVQGKPEHDPVESRLLESTAERKE